MRRAMSCVYWDPKSRMRTNERSMGPRVYHEDQGRSTAGGHASAWSARLLRCARTTAREHPSHEHAAEKAEEVTLPRDPWRAREHAENEAAVEECDQDRAEDRAETPLEPTAQHQISEIAEHEPARPDVHTAALSEEPHTEP